MNTILINTPEQAAALARALCPCPACVYHRSQRRGSWLVSDADAHANLMQLLDTCTPFEVSAVRAELRLGRIFNDAASCVIAVIATCRGLNYASIDVRAPLFEMWLGRLPRMATPETNAQAATLDRWLTEWLEAHTLHTVRRLGGALA